MEITADTLLPSIKVTIVAADADRGFCMAESSDPIEAVAATRLPAFILIMRIGLAWPTPPPVFAPLITTKLAAETQPSVMPPLE